jgi:hypothetical protein
MRTRWDIQNLTEKDFPPPSARNKLVAIYVNGGKIQFIQKELFSKFPRLTNLYLKNLPLKGETIKNSLLNSNQTKLIRLCLENVGLNAVLVKELYPHLPTNLTLLGLRNNNIASLSMDYIPNTKIEILDLSYNKNLTLLINRTAFSLRKLLLSYSGFEWNTVFRVNGTCAFPKLKNLEVEGLKVNMPAVDIQNNCFDNITALQLSNCDFINPIDRKSFSYFPNLRSLYLDKISNMEHLPSFKKAQHLYQLSLNDVNYTFPPTIQNINSFLNLRKIKRLKMQGWDLKWWNSSQLNNLFTPIANTIETLDLTSTGLTKVPCIVSKMNKLKTVRLGNNSISSWDCITENTNTNLKTFCLPFNLIETVDPRFIPRNVYDFNLSGNPFRCTCELMPYKNWVLEKKLSRIIQDWQIHYQCAEPLEWKDKTLSSFRPKKTDCQPFNDYVITALVLCCLMVVTVVTASVYTHLKRKCQRMEPLDSGSCERQKLLSGL